MIPDAEKDGPVQAVEHDPRVTKIGRFMRGTAMDELPQLVNIFKGDMSFVGPRALRPQEKEVTAFIDRTLKVDSYIRTADFTVKEGVFTGRYCLNPATGEEIPIYVANFVLFDYGTGAIMAVPTHDQRDFEFAKKYNLGLRVVIKPPDRDLKEEAMTEAYEEEGILVNSCPFNGQKNLAALDSIAEYLEANGIGYKTANFKLRDWNISRQRYWGAPIPMITCDK